MATATVEQVQTKFQMIDLGKISESPMNPRKHFDPQSLKELAESIKAHGVQQPIVVRPDGNKADRFEIVVGARRSRAAKLAGVKEIPAVIRELSNAAALEIMVIENLQREDVHPLDEALGYEALLKKHATCEVCNTHSGHRIDCPNRNQVANETTVQTIAAKVGKSVGYVYARMKLLALCCAAREAFEQDHITAGHAVLIARLQPSDQLKALAACFKNYITQFELQNINKLDPQSSTWVALLDAISIGAPNGLRLASEKFLREWIQENINLSLKSVPWDLADEKLVPEAGSCGSCLKRSVSNPSLFLGLTRANDHDNCFDPACFQAKQKAFVKLQLKTAKTAEKPLVQISEQTAYTKPKEGEKILKRGQWLPAKKGECEGVTKALIVRGENAGEQQLVCADLNCKVHKRHLSSGGTSSRSNEPKRDEAAEKKAAEDNRKFKLLLFDKIRAKFDGASRAIAQMMLEQLIDLYGPWNLKGLVEHNGWKGTPEKVLREKVASLPIAKAWNLLGEITLWSDIRDEWEELGKYLPVAAKAHKIDVAKLSKEFKLQPEKPAAKKAKAGK